MYDLAVPNYDVSMKYRIALFVALVTVIGSAQAKLCDEAVVGVHIGTYHLNREYKFNEFNPGVYGMCNRWTAGVYHNSEGRTSVYGGYTFSVRFVDITVGAVTGYSKGTMPLIVPSVKLPFGGVRIAFIPKTPGVQRSSAGIHLMKDF